MIAIVVLNGAPPSVKRLQELAKQAPVFAADGGSAICLQAGIRPEWVAGDLDSASREQFPSDWEIHHHPEQTRTDFQKVMADLPDTVTEVRVLGGLGGRVDHQFTNLLLAAGFPETPRILFEFGSERLLRVTPSSPLGLDLPLGSTVSLLPIPEAEGVTTQGLRWNLENARMKAGAQLGQSNEVIGPVRISLESGCLFLWMEQTDF